jgi:hypothetical protein
MEKSLEPVKKRRKEGQQLQNMNRNPIHEYANTHEKLKLEVFELNKASKN